MAKILIIEDDNDINLLIQKLFKKEKFEVISAFSGTEGKLLIDMHNVDIVICDLMLPGLSGEELISYIRSKYDMPIIALTAKGSLEDKTNIFQLGADDYITKPFEPKELILRINAQLRRMGIIAENILKKDKILKFKDIVMYLDSMVVEVKKSKIELTLKEFQILEIMIKNPNRVYSKDFLYEQVSGNGYYGEDNTICVHVSNIRKKIEKVTKEEYISTVWGIGYKLNT